MQDIGNLAYRYSVGRAKGLPSLSTFIADNLFSIIIQILFLVQVRFEDLRIYKHIIAFMCYSIVNCY